jgi:hypothetical protein
LADAGGENPPSDQSSKTVSPYNYPLAKVETALDQIPMPQLTDSALAVIHKLQANHERELGTVRQRFATVKERCIGLFRELQAARREGRILYWLRSIFLVGLGYLLNIATRPGEGPKDMLQGANLVVSIVTAAALVGSTFGFIFSRSETKQIASRLSEVERLEP